MPKDISNTIASFAFYLFVVVVAGWMVTNNYDMLYIASGSDMMSLLGTALFEGGAVVWLLFFLYRAQGENQRGIALLGSALDLLLGIASVGIHLSMRVDKAWTAWVVTIILLATIVNAILLWAAHIADPKNIEAMQAQSHKDKTMKLAYKIAEDKRGETAAEIADAIADKFVTDAHNSLLLQHKATVKPSAPSVTPALAFAAQPSQPAPTLVTDVPKN